MAAARRRLAFDDRVELDPWEGATNAIRDILDERGSDRAREEEEERRRREEHRTRRMSIAEWLDHVPEAHGPVDLRKFAFQREPLYSDAAVEDAEQVHEKATQVGWSTGAIRLALYHADVRQRSVLYTFPTEKELGPFSQSRFGPIIRGSEHLSGRMRQDDGGAVDNIGAKRIGFNGWLFLRGTDKPIESLPIDLAIFDEYNYSDQANIEQSERRVTGPNSLGLIRRLGVPTLPGFGISTLYENSDQRVWTVRCSCGHWNPLSGMESFLANVDQDAIALVCAKPDCRRPLDVRGVETPAEWVARYPDRDVKGYHAPKLLIPGRRVLAGVIANSKKTRPDQVEAFINRDLGKAYAPKEGRLSLEQVQACVRLDVRPLDPWAVVPPSSRQRFMGVDVASVRALNVTIEEALDEHTSVKLWTGEIEDDPVRGTAFQQLCMLMDRFGIAMAGIDDGPEGRFALAFAARYPGRVYRCSFFSPGPQQKKAPEPWMVDDEAQFVSLWRTRAYDATFERFRMQRVLLPPLEMLPPDYAQHLGNLYRQKTEMERKDPSGQKVSTGVIRVDYVKTGPEDYAQAEAYCLAALELYWRAVGLDMIVGAGPQPLSDLDPDAAVEDVFAADGYRAGFE